MSARQRAQQTRRWLNLLAALVVCAYGLAVWQTRPFAPEFVLPELQTGRPLQLTALRGRGVLLTFFSVHCGWSRNESPFVEQYALAHPEVTVLIITRDADEELEALRAWVSEYLPHAVVVRDRGSQVFDLYGVTTTPTTIVVDARGRMQAIRTAGVIDDYEAVFGAYFQ
jgi:peroxiredoxin